MDHFHEYTLDACPDCGGELHPSMREPRIVQQADAKPFVVSEYPAHAAICAGCRKIHYAPLPKAVEKAGLLGPRLTAQVAWLKRAGHLSYSTAQRYLRDVFGLEVSRGVLAKTIHKEICALRDPYAKLLTLLAEEAVLNVDETGHKENRKRMWTWCFRAEDFAGVLGCDYFSAYRKYMRACDVRVQFCLAHLIRDLNFLTTLGGHCAAYGERLLDAVRPLFGIVHRGGKMGRNAFSLAMFNQLPENHRYRHPRCARHAPCAKHGRTIREARGRQWCERAWTVMATCAI